MAVELSTRTVALVDSDQDSRTILELAHRASGPVTILATVDTKLANTEPDVVRSLSADPTMKEVLALAAERGAPWVIMRRGVTAPQNLLAELIMGAGKADTSGIPGFGVLLVGPHTRTYNRVLVVADRSAGPMSGLMIYMATVIAHRASATLDVLVIGAPGEEVDPTEEFEALAVNREAEYLQAARELAAESGQVINWLAADQVTDSAALVAAQCRSEAYDLVIDDIGELVVGRSLGRDDAPQAALRPGGVAAVPYAVLAATDVDVLLVIDEIRVGLLTSRMLRIGAVAAAALAVVAGGTMSVRSATSPAAEATAATAEASQQTLNELVETADVIGAAKDRAEAATQQVTSRGGSTRKGSKQSAASAAPQGSQKAAKPKAPKGGASQSDVKKAKKSQAKAKAEYQQAKADAEAAAAKAAKADDALAAAKDELARALTEITSAQQTYDEAVIAAQHIAEANSGIAKVLPSAPTPEEVAAAEAAVTAAEQWLAAATARGEQAIADIEAAEAREASTNKQLGAASAEASQAKGDFQAAKMRTEVYVDSYTDSKQLPVKKGQFHFTARFGDPGSAWSKGYHTGLDFAAPTGTNVYAAASGKVVEAGWGGAYGNRIGIKLSDGTYTWYNHLSNIGVSVGDSISAGDKIGDVGNTGNSFGSHLHFEVTRGGDGWAGGSFIDPAKWLGL